MSAPPLVVHLTYALDFGGLETLIVESINRMPATKYRHAIVCLTRYTEFAKKITRPDVEIIALNKPPGLALGTHAQLWKVLRRMRPTILHTYNLAAIEYSLVAMLAGVPVRIHAEHGRDASDPDGANRKHNLLRRLLTPVVDCFVPVSRDLQSWLGRAVGVPAAKNLLINNGVDTTLFRPATGARPQDWPDFSGCFVIGTVGRIQDVKDHAGLVDAFALLRTRLAPDVATRLRLVIVGDGPLRPALQKKVATEGLDDVVWLPGARNDIAAAMQTFSLFALSSIAEGTPVTLLEAMASALPVVSTGVGGIPDLVLDNATGMLVPASDPAAMADALAAYVRQPELLHLHGSAGRRRIEERYSIGAMLASYGELYDRLTRSKTKLGTAAAANLTQF